MTAFQKSTVSALLLLVASACTSYYEVPIETPLQPKLEVSRFQRILVAGFLAGGSNDVDANLETARLLKSQLRNESRLDVIDAEVLDLLAIAEIEGDVITDNTDGLGRSAQQTNSQPGDPEEEDDVLSEEELEAYESIFANVTYWRQLGEEHQNPLIVTGSVHFTPHQRAGMISREREIYDDFGRRRVVPMRAYRESARPEGELPYRRLRQTMHRGPQAALSASDNCRSHHWRRDRRRPEPPGSTCWCSL